MRPRGEIDVVCDQHQCRAAFLVQFLHEVYDPLASLPIQVSGRLIRKQNPGLVGEGACKSNPLLLTTRKLSRIVAGAVRQSHTLEKRHRPRTNGASGLPRSTLSKLHRHHHVLEGGERGKEMEGLEYEPYVLGTKPRPTVFRKSLEILARYGYRALSRLVEPGEETQERGLAAARRADDRHEALRFQVEIDSVQHTEGLTPTHVRL